MSRATPNLTHASGYNGDGFTPEVVNQFGMIGKVAYQIIREVQAKNPLSAFDFVPVDNGDTIEEVVTKLVESKNYDPTGANALTPNTDPKMAVRYFNNWKRKKFEQTINLSELRKVMIRGGSADELASKLVSTLSASDTYDKYLDIKETLVQGRTAGSASDGTNSVFIPGTDVTVKNKDFSAVLTQIKDTVDGFTFVSTLYNRAGILQNCRKEDVRIIMPYKLKNSMDVNTLTGFFNLEKGDINEVIIPIDTDDGYIYIIDKMALQAVTRLYMMMDQKNADAGTWNYFLHVERLYALVELFNATYFKVTIE